MKRILAILISVVGFILFAMPAYASSEVVYDALPSVTPQTNYPSQPFQAQQTFEFGDYIHLGGTARILKSVTVTMSDWALYSDYTGDLRYNADSSYWTHPITLNVYSVVAGTPNTLGPLLGSVTQTISIPWRPAPDGCDATGWEDTFGHCNHGLAFNATFDLSSLNLTVPDDIIVSLAYNTQTWGYSPIGTPGPYNSLNVAVPENQTVSVGNDYSNDEVFWNTHTCSYYADGGTSGCNVFREDTNWSPYGTVALKLEADYPEQLQGKDVRKATGGIWMSGPSQQMQFSAFDQGATMYDKGSVEYWNYDYPGVLHYAANVLCASVDYGTGNARFMFQIPEGWPGLTGLYVVAGVHDGGTPGTNGDTYGHAATADLVTATQWCETGNGFSPSMYPIVSGNLVVHK